MESQVVKRMIKWLLAGLGVVVLVVAITALVLPLLIDPNDYKQEIGSVVHAQTGRDLGIAGEIEWSVFPWIGLDLSDVSLSNPPGFGDQPMLTAGKVSVSVRLMPLFHGALEFGSVELSDLTVHLQRKPDGITNWGGLATSSSEPAPAPAQEDGEARPFKLAAFAISHANVTWDDAGRVTSLQDLSIEATHIEPGRPFDLKGGFSVSVDGAALNGRADFSGRILESGAGRHYKVDGLRATFKGRVGEDAQALNLDLGIGANADFDLQSDQAVLSDFSLHLFKLTLHGQMTIKTLSATPRASASLELDEFSPRQLLEALGIGAPATANSDALGSMSGAMTLEASAGRVAVRDLRLQFDQSEAAGSLRLENLEDPKLDFEFRLDRLNLDDYMAGTGGGDSTEAPANPVPGFRIAGKLQIGQLTLAGLKASDVLMSVNGDGKRLRLYPVNARVYGGVLTTDATIDSGGGRPLLAVRQQLKGIRAGDLLQDLTGSARLTGLGDFNMDMSTDLSDARATREALSGRFDLNLHDGAINGIDITATLRKANALLGRQKVTASTADEENKTEFSEMSMTATIKGGVVSSDDLLLRSPLLRMTGKGRVDLVNETIDYEVAPTLEGKAVDELGSQLDKIRGVPVPVRLSGNLFKPSVKVDIAAAIGGAQKAKITAKGKALEKKVLGKLLGEKDSGDSGDAAQAADGPLQDSGQSDRQDKETQAEALLKGLFGSKRKKEQADNPEEDGGRP